MELIVGLVLASLLFLPVVILLIVRGQMSRKINVLNRTIIEISSGKEIDSVEDARESLRKNRKKQKRLRRQLRVKSRSIRNAKMPDFQGFEKFIGVNILNIVGIASLLASVVLFLKFSFSNDGISDFSRLMIGAIFGLVLIVLGFILRNKARVFSSVLTGGGLAIFYFIIGLAYLVFQITDWQTALIMIAATTLFSLLLSIGYDQVFVGFVALCGAYATYFVVDPLPQFYHVPQIYITIITLAVLILSVLKRWQLLYGASYAFTVFTLGFWLYRNIDQPYFDEQFSLIISTLTYLMLYGASTIYNIRRKDEFVAIDFLFVLTLNAGYFGIGLMIFDQLEDGLYNGLFTACLAFFNLIVVLVFSRFKGIDKNILYLIIGLVLTYITLVAPIEMDGNSVTLFWGCEAVILVYLQSKVKFKLIKNASLGVAANMLVSLVLDWKSYYATDLASHDLFLNKGFLATVFGAITLGVYSYFFARLNKNEKILLIPIAFWSLAAMLVTFTIAYVGGVLEIKNYVENESLNKVVLATYTAFFIYGFQLFTDFTNNKKLGNIAIVLATITIIIQLVHVELASIDLRNSYLEKKVSLYFFIIHYGGAIMACLMIGRYYKFIHHTYKIWSGIHHLTFWFLGIASLALMSLEGQHIYVLVQYSEFQDIAELTKQSISFVFPMVWIAVSCAMISIGTVKHIRDLRVIGLTFTLVTLCKFALYDFAKLNNSELILVFVCVGVCSMIASYYYQQEKSKQENVEE